MNFMRGFSRYIPGNTLAPTLKQANISPVTALAVRKDCIWCSVRVVPLSVKKTALVYDVYCKPGSTISRKEIVALRERSRSAILEFEARWCVLPLIIILFFSFFVSFDPSFRVVAVLGTPLLVAAARSMRVGNGTDSGAQGYKLR